MKRILLSFLTITILAVNGFVQDYRSQSLSNRSATSTDGSPIDLTLPVKNGSVRFAAIGDTGSGSRQQHEVAAMMLRYRQAFPFDFVLMLGDNLYGRERAKDYRNKFEDVYRPLLDSKVKFYATLGNHDQSNQRLYEHFNMDGKEYYRFKKGDVAFYALNSNYMDKTQLEWLEKELSKDNTKWKICFFHHPPYSSGKKHGSDDDLRKIVEPLFLKYGVNVVLAGHDHFYERIKPQNGIYYFVSGAGGKLRRGGVRPGSAITAKAFDRDLHFVLFEITGDELHFQAVTRVGQRVDSGALKLQQR